MRSNMLNTRRYVANSDGDETTHDGGTHNRYEHNAVGTIEP